MGVTGKYAVLGILLAMAVGKAFAAESLATVPVQYREVAQTYSAEGVVEAVRQSTVSAQISGRVKQVLFDVGDTVRKGQVLVRIDERLAQSAIKLVGAGFALAAVLWVCRGPAMNLFEGWHQFRDLATLVALMAVGGGVYGAIVLAIFGRDLLKRYRAAMRR